MFHTKKKSIIPYLFVFPVCLILFLLSYLPTPYMFYLSVHKTEMVTGNKIFVGLENFQLLLKNKNFWESAGNTLFYVIGATIAVVALSLLAAVILNSKIKGSNVYIAIMFIPWIVSDVVAAYSWRWLLNPDFGLLNYWFEPLGLRPSKLLTDPDIAMIGVIVVTVWKQLAYTTLLLLAGLQNVSNELIEASKLDGCSAWKSFWKVSVPIFSPMLCVTVLLDVITFISQAGLSLVLTDGGPMRVTETLSLYLYKEAFINFHLTNAASIGVAVAAVNIIIVTVYFYVNKKSRELVS